MFGAACAARLWLTAKRWWFTQGETGTWTPAPFSGICCSSISALQAGPQLMTSAGSSCLKNGDPSLAELHRCAHCWGHGEQHCHTDRDVHRYLSICWGPTSLMWLLGAPTVPVTAKMGNWFLGEAKHGTFPLFLFVDSGAEG